MRSLNILVSALIPFLASTMVSEAAQPGTAPKGMDPRCRTKLVSRALRQAQNSPMAAHLRSPEDPKARVQDGTREKGALREPIGKSGDQWLTYAAVEKKDRNPEADGTYLVEVSIEQEWKDQKGEGGNGGSVSMRFSVTRPEKRDCAVSFKSYEK